MKAQKPTAAVFQAFLSALACFAPVHSYAAAAAPDAALETVAERSKFLRTGRYDVVRRICDAYA
ncbi:MAG: hypothetical protein ACREU6_03440, partial [Steroidobacteraceae bacterium]